MNESIQNLNKGGGQVKQPNEILSCRVIFRMTKPDLEKLNTILKQRNISKSDYGRIVLLSGIDSLMEEQYLQALSLLKFEIRKVGVNINLVVKRLHQSKIYDMSQKDKDFIELMDKKIDETILVIAEAINNRRKLK